MDGVQHGIAIAGEMLSSWLALRIYVVIAAAALLAFCIWFTRQQRSEILTVAKIRGPNPKREKTIKKHLDYYEKHNKLNLLRLQKKFVAVIMFGFCIPSAIVALALHYYGWFIPERSALSLVGDKAIDVSLLQAAIFTLSQLTMGIGEHLPVFFANLAKLIGLPLDVATDKLQPANPVIELAVIVYRYFIGGFVTLLGHLSWLIIGIMRNPGEKIAKLRKQLAIGNVLGK